MKNNLMKKVDQIKSMIEKKTFKIGDISIKLTSMLVYISCLLGALVIWVNVSENSAETISRRFDNINVVIEGEVALSKNDLAVFDLIDKTVSVNVSGAKNRVNSLTDEDIVAYIDVSDVKEIGNARLSVSIKGLEKLDATASPSSVKTFIDKRVEVDVPLNVIPSYSIVSEYNHVLRANLETITVSGASSIVNSIAEARTFPELGELTTSVTASSPIVFVDEKGTEIKSDYISSALKNVVISAEVYTEKTVPLTYSFKYGYIKEKNIKVTLSPSEITLRGDPNLLAEIDSIPLSELDETKIFGNTEKVVNPKLPLGAVDINNTGSFNISIELLKYRGETVDIPTSEVVVKDIPGVEYKILDDTYDIRYIVDSDSYKRVSSSNFNVELDLTALSGASSGKYKVTPNITVDDVGYTLYPITNKQIEIEIVGENN